MADLDAILEDPDIIWGADAVGKVINRTKRQAHYMLETGALPARKVGGRWVASRRKLLLFLETYPKSADDAA
jgi:hypothetical protein